MVGYLTLRYVLALRTGRLNQAGLLLPGILLAISIPICLGLGTRLFRPASSPRQLLLGLLDIYHSVTVILLMALLGSEALVALEHGAEERARNECLARNAELDQLLRDIDRDAKMRRALRERLAIALAYADCSFDDWGPFSYKPLFFSLTVVTTIGYGTSSPATQGGRIFTAFFALGTIGVALYCLGRVATAIERATMWALSRLLPPTGAIDKVFARYDEDGSRSLQYAEFRELLTDLQHEGVMKIDMAQFEALMHAADRDNSGEVSLLEFKRALAESDVDVRSFVLTKYKTAVILALNIALLVIATLVPYETQDGDVWTNADNFYYAVISLSTVGLGDLTVSTHSPAAILSFVTFCVGGLGLFAALVTTITDFVPTMVNSCRAAARRPREQQRTGGSTKRATVAAATMNATTPLSPQSPLSAPVYEAAPPQTAMTAGGRPPASDGAARRGAGEEVPRAQSPGRASASAACMPAEPRLVIRSGAVCTAGFDAQHSSGPRYVGTSALPLPAPPRDRPWRSGTVAHTLAPCAHRPSYSNTARTASCEQTPGVRHQAGRQPNNPWASPVRKGGVAQ